MWAVAFGAVAATCGRNKSRAKLTHFCVAPRDQLSRHPHTDVHSISRHTRRRPSNIRRLSPVMSVRRLHREAHGGISCVDGDL